MNKPSYPCFYCAKMVQAHLAARDTEGRLFCSHSCRNNYEILQSYETDQRRILKP
jgi:endogenous inhibitor of DNA gyrase (YacG/DUF329 family)